MTAGPDGHQGDGTVDARRLGPKTLARASVLALAVLLPTAGIAFADTLTADGDSLTSAVESTVDLGTVAPNAVFTRDVAFVLTCAGTAHLDPDMVVTLLPGTLSVPGGGNLTVPSATLTAPAGWPLDGANCPSPAPTTSVVDTLTFTAPPTTGDVTYRAAFNRRVSNGDTTGVSMVSGGMQIEFTLHVSTVTNTPPVLHLPASMSAEATGPTGAAVSYVASATDAEDATAPTPTCSPASGSAFALGVTTVSCSATDGGGLTTSGSFTITVGDTTPPVLHVPGTVTVGTLSASGTAVTYQVGATDAVDPSPAVACAPASGSVFAVGSTTVSCTATDASGNSSKASFGVEVRLDSIEFEPPVGPSNVVESNVRRTIPVKVHVAVGGSEVTSGDVVLAVAPCDGGASKATIPLTRVGGRWVGKVRTDALGAGCWLATLLVDGSGVGSFRIDVVDPSAAGGSTNGTVGSGKGDGDDRGDQHRDGRHCDGRGGAGWKDAGGSTGGTGSKDGTCGKGSKDGKAARWDGPGHGAHGSDGSHHARHHHRMRRPS